jgi:hypothetical protein
MNGEVATDGDEVRLDIWRGGMVVLLFWLGGDAQTASSSSQEQYAETLVMP